MSKYEKLVKDDVKEIKCTNCNKTAARMLAAPRCFQNTVGKSPSC